VKLEVVSVVIGTAGHIDHGKSALVRALTGTDPDRLKEEQARGITIDLGFAHAEVDGVNLAFVDVPGHERFVKNMLAGAGGVDIVMLVVAADESVMPQTREHFQICRLLRVPSGVIVLTKSDLADADMIELARMEVRELAAGSFLEQAPVIAVSSKTGDGLDELRRVLVDLSRGLPARGSDGPARLPIDRVFSVRGFGTVVTGTLVSGTLRDGQELVALPRGIPVKVRGLQVHGRAADSAGAGRRVAVNAGGVELADLARGDTLAEAGTLEPSQRLDAAIDLLADARALKHGTRVRFHHGTTELLGRVAVAAPCGREGSAGEVPPGGCAYVRIRLERPAVVTRGDRFIMRAYSPSVTIGGGVVLDPHPPRSAIRTAAGVARFGRIDSNVPAADAVMSFIDERGAAGLDRNALVARAGLTPADAARVAGVLVESRRATAVAQLLVASSAVDSLSVRLVAALEAHHAAEPLSEGVPREEVRERLFGRASGAVFDHVVNHLADSGRIVARERLALATHRVSLSGEETAALQAVGRAYRDAGLTPPDAAGAAAAAGVSPAVADRVTKLLLRQKTLQKLDVLLFHVEALDRLKAEVRALKDAGAPATVDVAAFKERYGITRKYAIPLLEYLDRERVTRRVGDGRIVL
jgi:selenocysteine-specific elongation factor